MTSIKKRFFLTKTPTARLLFGVAAILFVICLVSGCQNQTDKATIDAAPPAPPNAKAAVPAKNKTLPFGNDSVSGAGGGGGGSQTTVTTSETTSK
jgi:hypothetical protein